MQRLRKKYQCTKFDIRIDLHVPMRNIAGEVVSLKYVIFNFSRATALNITKFRRGVRICFIGNQNNVFSGIVLNLFLKSIQLTCEARRDFRYFIVGIQINHLGISITEYQMIKSGKFLQLK